MSERDLFGGALSVVLPVRFEDVSGVRQVPDTQEVFVDAATDESVIIELLEHDATITDTDAAVHFLTDIAQLNGAREASVVEVTSIAGGLNQLPQASYVAVALGRQKVAKFRESAANSIAVWLGCVRLAAAPVCTDIVVSLNSPLAFDPHSSSATTASALPSQDQARAIIFHALETLHVRDWSIFG